MLFNLIYQNVADKKMVGLVAMMLKEVIDMDGFDIWVTPLQALISWAHLQNQNNMVQHVGIFRNIRRVYRGVLRVDA